jgi:hypothetical protein
MSDMPQPKTVTIKKRDGSLEKVVRVAAEAGASPAMIVDAITKGAEEHYGGDWRKALVEMYPEFFSAAEKAAIEDGTGVPLAKAADTKHTVISSNARSSRLTAGAGHWAPVPVEKEVSKAASRKKSDAEARDEQIQKNVLKVRADIRRENG